LNWSRGDLGCGKRTGRFGGGRVVSTPEQELLPMPLLMCPNCNEGMQEVRRNEVQIDVCPKCRGVWLDRGELEKLLHSAREVEADYERERESWMRQPAYQPQHHPSGYGPHGHYKKKKKFSDLFDIFD
jgi:uncharacterized protein